MGYRVLGKTEELLQGYGPRKGLEGPYLFGRNNMVLYYDAQEGKYWNPRTDFYMSDDEMSLLNKQLIEMVST